MVDPDRSAPGQRPGAKSTSGRTGARAADEPGEPMSPRDPNRGSVHDNGTPERAPDPTRVREQDQLRSASGRLWLLLGGLLCLVALALLVPLLWTGSAIPIAGIAAVVVLYAGMVAVRLSVADRRRRLPWLAVLMALMAVCAILALFLVALTESEPL